MSPELLQWADLICVMEPIHRQKLTARFFSELTGKRIVCLNIPDEFQFMEPALIKLLDASVTRYLPS